MTRSVTTVFAEEPGLFSGIIESIAGPTATAETREIAWQRHGAWCHGLFYDEAIFSPDNDIDIPLLQVYQKLRCYWNDKHEKERDGEREPLKYRTATVGDLHKTIHTWLRNFDESDALRLIAGGPGSGKSSFAKAFAAELFQEKRHKVLFIQLQKLQTTTGTTLRKTIGRHLKSRYGYKLPNKCEGFPENPLNWHGNDTRPLFMIFDGLDELTTNKDRESDLAKKFVSNLKLLLNELNSAGQPASAIILGRDLAMNAALEDGDLGLDNLIHVAPIRKMTRNDLHLDQNPSDDKIYEGFNPVIDPNKLMEKDTRKSYWKQWCLAKGIPESEPPAAIHDERMSELNVEPLLLHLLIISDFCGNKWVDAIENRNLMYENIFNKIFKRNKDKDLDAYRKLEKKHFFELMEVFGLVAFRGNGRTGDHKEFECLRKLYTNPKTEKDIYSMLDGANLKNVALMVHSRREIEGAGFEFLHKSFGEYLAARALLGAADRLQYFWNNDENNKDELKLALHWVNLVGAGELSNSILSFLHDECRQRTSDQIGITIKALTAIFNRTLEHGFPVQKSDYLLNPTYRDLEHWQKCAEKAMLAMLTSLWLARKSNDKTNKTPLIALRQFESSRSAASRMINRLFSSTESRLGIKQPLSGIDFKNSNLVGAFIHSADLRGANLSGTNLSRADLIGADLNGADLNRADLTMSEINGANLSNANLNQANLKWASLGVAKLIKANLIEANLCFAKLMQTDFSEANLTRANLAMANLSGANLYMVNLSDANLCRAELSGAKLEFVDLTKCRTEGMSVRSVNFTNAKLTQKQVNEFFGIKSGIGKTLLPDCLSYPDHWYDGENVTDLVASYEYEPAWLTWLIPQE